MCTSVEKSHVKNKHRGRYLTTAITMNRLINKSAISHANLRFRAKRNNIYHPIATLARGAGKQNNKLCSQENCQILVGRP